MAFRVEPTCPPEFLGDLPAEEIFVNELSLPWDGDWLVAGRRLIPEALSMVAGTVPDRLQVRTNPESHDEHAERIALFDTLGMDLFQEKESFTWLDPGTPVDVPGRLEFRTIDEVGRDRFRGVIAGVGEDTLDRNDRYYRSHMDPDDWGAVYLTFVEDADAPMWLLGLLPNGDAAGFVAVSNFDGSGTATIAFIGVLPEHRGNGYVDDLMAAGIAAAQRNGFTAMLSDVDVQNTPMLAAMERAGHHAGVRPWHVWHHIGSVEAMR